MSSLTRPTSLDSRRRRVVLAVAVATLLPLGVLPAAAATAPTASPAAASGPQRSSPQQTPPALQAAIVRAKLTASDGVLYDHFGGSVAVDGDTAVVGAWGHDAPGGGYGAAYVFVRSGSGWVQQAELIASGADYFGFSVAVQGDTAVIGAPATEGYEGAAYVFTRSGSTWTQRAELVVPGSFGRELGGSVALAGDTAVVGANADSSPGAYAAGAAYVFVRSGAGWIQQARLAAADAARGDEFGWSVGLDGETTVVGAPGDDPGTGSAYVFVRSGTTWTQQAKLTASVGAANDLFGWSVGLDDETTVVGAPGRSGAAYVFGRTGTTWTQQAKLTGSDVAIGDAFGGSVSVSGRSVVVGAPFQYSYKGATFEFARSGSGAWTQRAMVTAPDASGSDEFGASVAVNGDTAVVGAVSGDSISTSDTGAAYILGL